MRSRKKKLLGGAAICLICGVLYYLLVPSSLERVVAKLASMGEPTSFAGLLPKPSAEPNAADYLIEIYPQASDLADLELGLEAEAKLVQHRELNEADFRQIAERFDKQPFIMQNIATAARCSRFDWPTDAGMDIAHVDLLSYRYIRVLHAIARACEIRMGVLRRAQRFDEAIATGVDLLRIARMEHQQFGCHHYLSNLGVRHLAVMELAMVLHQPQTANASTKPLADRSFQLLEDELARHRLAEEWPSSFQAERAITLERYRRCKVDWLKQLTFDPVAYNAVFEVRFPFVSKLAFECPSFPYSNLKQIRETESTCDAVWRGMNDLDARMKCLRIRACMIRLAREHSLEKLSELPLPAPVFVDPFSGKSLLLKKTPVGLTPYSVGEDRVDSGGDFSYQNDIGLIDAHAK